MNSKPFQPLRVVVLTLASLAGGCTSDPNSTSIFYDASAERRDRASLANQVYEQRESAIEQQQTTVALRQDRDALHSEVRQMNADFERLASRLSQTQQPGAQYARQELNALRARSQNVQSNIDSASESELAGKRTQAASLRSDIAALNSRIDKLIDSAGNN